MTARRSAWLALLVAGCTGAVSAVDATPDVAVRGATAEPLASPRSDDSADPTATGPSSGAVPSVPAPSSPLPKTSSAPSPSAPCPDDMALLGRFCIDRYEAPNREGATPLLMQSALDGQAWCAERSKRLCLESEWVRACSGPSGWNYPYGSSYQASVCNDDKTWRAPKWPLLRGWPSEAAAAEARRLDQSEPAGARSGCKSAEGVFDLTGNAAEWVVRTEDNPTNYEHVVKGCYWSRCFRPPHAPACDYVNYAHVGAERSYEMGFRCCRDAG